ncbi:hypothetical protein [Streptomyces wuyuanensis]|uniref:hypothetical protein n=1 Tax=Streptomyces wuyuanensis TaxID=1196353 RepID=UPI00370FC8BF
MTEPIRLPGPKSDWAPATSSQARGGNPAWQCSMFQAATEPLVSLALLAVELDMVAQRLRLTIGESWDGHGAVRAAFFTLGGTDFVVTHHEGDPPGTCVWVWKSGPVDPAERMALLLAALGVGAEAVSYSTWGVGTDLSRLPATWGRGGVMRRPVESHERFWQSFRERTGMYVSPVTFHGVTAYLNGYDHGCGGALLNGFRQWLADRYEVGPNLVWWAQVVQVVFPEGRPSDPWADEQHHQAVAGTLTLLEEYFQHLSDQDGTPPQTD